MVSYEFHVNKYIEITVVDQRGFMGWGGVGGGGGQGWGTKVPPPPFLSLLVSYWFLAIKGKIVKRGKGGW